MTTTASSRVAKVSASVGALVAVASGVVHGFGRDDETMYGATHIAVGHLLPVLVAACTVVWLTNLFAGHERRGRTGVESVALATAQVGLCLWSVVTGVESLGLYVMARTAPAVAVHPAHPALGRVAFVVAALSMLAGLLACLVTLVRSRSVTVTTAVLVLLGTPGAFVAGPVGDFVLALGLGWYAVGAARGRLRAVEPAVAGA